MSCWFNHWPVSPFLSLSPQASLSNQPAICFKGSQGVRCFAYSPANVWEPERSNYFWFVVEHAYDSSSGRCLIWFLRTHRWRGGDFPNVWMTLLSSADGFCCLELFYEENNSSQCTQFEGKVSVIFQVTISCVKYFFLYTCMYRNQIHIMARCWK